MNIAKIESILFGCVLSGMMSLLVSGISTARAIGVGDAFLATWLGAWLAAWMVAFPAVLVAAPLSRRLVRRLLGVTGPRPPAAAKSDEEVGVGGAQ